MSLLDKCGGFVLKNFEKGYLITGYSLIFFGAGKFIYDSVSMANKNDGLTEAVIGGMIYVFGEFTQGSIIKPSEDLAERINSIGEI